MICLTLPVLDLHGFDSSPDTRLAVTAQAVLLSNKTPA
jgi:hypothetical protein